MENFLNVLIEDATVREEFLQQTTPEGAYLVAKPYIDGMPMEEFVENLLGISRVMDKAQNKNLSNAELVTVLGGSAELLPTFMDAMAAFNEHF